VGDTKLLKEIVLKIRKGCRERGRKEGRKEQTKADREIGTGRMEE
jgi:hypothetical protein